MFRVVKKSAQGHTTVEPVDVWFQSPSLVFIIFSRSFWRGQT